MIRTVTLAAQRPGHRGLPLRVLIAGLFVGLLAAAGVAGVGYGYVVTSRLLLSAGDEEFLHVAERTAGQVRDLLAPRAAPRPAPLAPSARGCRQPRRPPGLASPAHDRPERAPRDLRRLRRLRQRGIPPGSLRGAPPQIGRVPPEAVFLVQSRPAGDGAIPGRFRFLDRQLAVLSDELRPDYLYDPRARGWYAQALPTAAAVRSKANTGEADRLRSIATRGSAAAENRPPRPSRSRSGPRGGGRRRRARGTDETSRRRRPGQSLVIASNPRCGVVPILLCIKPQHRDAGSAASQGERRLIEAAASLVTALTRPPTGEVDHTTDYPRPLRGIRDGQDAPSRLPCNNHPSGIGPRLRAKIGHRRVYVLYSAPQPDAQTSGAHVPSYSWGAPSEVPRPRRIGASTANPRSTKN